MRNAFPVALALAAVLAGCGNNNGEPDAGVDDSCPEPRLDCAAQKRYGLIINRCFEYEQSGDPGVLALGVIAKRIFDIEKGRMVIEVEYNQSGQIRMLDAFFFEGQDLLLARRTWPGAGSVTYRDQAAEILGAQIWRAGTVVPQSFVRTVYSDFSGQPLAETNFRGVATPPNSTENPVPAGSFANAVAIAYTETPSSRFDPRRVLAEDTGFTVINTTLISTSTSAATQYRLLRFRDVGTQAGGSHACGMPAP